MDLRMNGLTLLAVVLVVALVLGFAWAMTQFLIPATVAQIAANQGLVQQVNQAFAEENKADEAQRAELETWKARIEAKIETLEKR